MTASLRTDLRQSFPHNGRTGLVRRISHARNEVEAIAKPSSASVGGMDERSPRRLVVVGHGMVGHRLVEAVLQRDVRHEWSVTVLSEEPRPAYDRVALSSLFAGVTPDGLALPAFERAVRVDVRPGEAACAVDRGRCEVTTSSGSVVGYDALVLATGSAPFVPPIPGSESCFVYRTVDDVAAIKAAVSASGSAQTGVVVGGGLLGLEAADALRRLGLRVHVVEHASRLMPMQLDDGGAEALRQRVEALGLVVRLGTPTVSFAPSGHQHEARRLRFDDGSCLDADVVVFSAGGRPRDELARACGLPVGPRGGVVVDAGCRSADPRVWAVGEVACVDGAVFGLVAPGYAMAEVVADRLLGGDATFADADVSTKLKLLGVDVASFGDAFATAPNALALVYANPVAGDYKKLVVSDDASRLLGGMLVGDASEYAMLRPLVGADLPLPADPAALLRLGDGGSSATAGTTALPSSALVCSCNAVTKGALCSAIDGGARDLGELKAQTRAGTGCGSCVPLMKAILGERLAAAGVAMSKALCEHFDQSRAELFDIVRVTGIRTFSRLVAEYGRGRGCDICKPAVASILASLGSGHILVGEQATLQDTNDHFLANLQKDGTYSVVPRIPGGEITPAKLAVIAEVAADFGLYTKITGAQRIDMFGARLEQLPAIWRRLVDAGFESGHAYGKALRTVKSCVGSTWCRFGVQDSVRLAIDLELRYRGLRSPHKVKAAVSGCARECAEARGKDFGVIATEKGWNLYLGGNGGFSPRHAELFAQDLDTATLVRTVDRFLMFYVRTADRLQRTSSWIESLDGGIDYLRSVIVDDALGICAELDEAMAAHVRDYRDEWQGALDDPQVLARFVSFVNAPDADDDTVRFVPERRQHRPATVAERIQLADQEAIR
jgi:nitrite reductase (NADH) large subunit